MLDFMFDEKVPIELIETLWNVNMWDEDTGALMAGELIETLWNVNPKNITATAVASGINRNIVECKFVRG